jgi:hypothetical protein
MAQHIPPPSTTKPAALTRVQRRTTIARLQQRLRELQAFDPTTVSARDEPRIGVLERAIDPTLVRSFGAGTAAYRRYSGAQRLDRVRQVIGRPPSLHEIRRGFQRGKQASIALLESLITCLQARLD